MAEKNSQDLEIARDFLHRVSVQLDLDPTIIAELTPHLLGLTKRVAHGVVRPAAPLAAFLVGYAAARGTFAESGDAPIADAVARALLAIDSVDGVAGDADGQA